MQEGQYDVVICDSFNPTCQEAAHRLNVPTIITSSMPLSHDAGAPYINNDLMSLDIPTTQFMGFWARFYTKLIKPIEFLWKSYRIRQELNTILVASGSDPIWTQEARWKDSVKMFNTAFGIQQGRPLGPLIEFVGPIVKSKVPKLDPELESYLAHHERVAYVGFGQNAMLSSTDIELILTGVLEAYEADVIDGILWSTRGMTDNFPTTMVSSSNTTWNIQHLLSSGSDDIVFKSWAPQMAILRHPSVSMNINHGGSASIYESLYAGVRMVIYPFFGDQPAAVVNAEKNKYGKGIHGKMAPQEVSQIIQSVAEDKTGELQRNTDRFKALVQIRSKHGVIKGADLVEEVLFLNQDGKVTHRRDVKLDISIWKATNLDVYGLAAVLLCTILYSVYHLVLGNKRNVVIKQKTM